MFKVISWIISYVLAFLIVAGLAIALVNQYQPNPATGDPYAKDPIIFGHGVYYFENHDELSFGHSLAKFISENTCRIVSITPFTAQGSWTRAYYVVCEPPTVSNTVNPVVAVPSALELLEHGR